MVTTIQMFTASLIVKLYQPMGIAILAMGAIEFVSLALVIGSRKKTQLKHKASSKRLIYAIPVSLYLALFILALWDLHNIAPISSSLLGGGVSLFLIGWWIRYRVACLDWIGKHVRKIRPLVNRVMWDGPSIAANVRHSRELGAWLEITGIAIVSKSILAIVPSLIIFPSVLCLVIIVLEHGIEKKVRDRMHQQSRMLIPGLKNALFIILVPVLVGFLTAIISREIVIFNGDIDTARSLLTTVTQIEGTLGVLAITIIFVLVQLTSSGYSTRAASVLFRHWDFWLPLSILGLSITYNILILSRLSTIFPENTPSESIFLDLCLLGGCLTGLSIAFFIRRAPRLISPEAIVRDALKDFDNKWMSAIRRNWQQSRPRQTVQLSERDPLLIVERILAKSIESRDNASIIKVVTLLRDKICSILSYLPEKEDSKTEEIERKQDPITLDAYLYFHLRGIIRLAAEQSDDNSLSLILQYLIRDIGAPSPEGLATVEVWPFENPPGEKLLREIINQSLENSLIEPFRYALADLNNRADIFLTSLPSEKETWLYNPDRNHLSNLPKSEQNVHFDKDRRIDSFSYGYLTFLGDKGCIALEKDIKEFHITAGMELNNIVTSIAREVKGASIKRRLVIDALYNVNRIVDAAIGRGESYALYFGLINHAIEHFENSEESIVYYLAVNMNDTLSKVARAGLLNYGLVVDFAMMYLDMCRKFIKPAILLVKGMGEAAKQIKAQSSFKENQEQQIVYRELIGRIRQPRDSGITSNSDILLGIKVALGELGEPEFVIK